MIIIYRKSDLVCVGKIDSTFEFEIEFNVIPNFGGTIYDYATIETDRVDFHLELINGVITIVDNLVIPPQPSELDIVKQQVFELQGAVDFLAMML